MSLSIFNGSGCRSQERNEHLIDRQPWAAGRFYPGDPSELKAKLKEMFSMAKPRSVNSVVAIICPHAGYEYSGIVAASSFNQVDPDKAYDNVFVIGSSHHVSFMGASVYNAGDYITPLGKVKVNTELANQLIKSNAVFTFQKDAEQYEHTVEVQVPFLQYYLKKSFKLVPIILGTQSEQSCKKIAQLLKPYLLKGNNLFVFSTDFSHYPAYNDAKANDKRTCDAILSNSVDAFSKILKDNASREISDLATSCCGWTSITTLLYMTSDDPSFTYTPVMYQNSGDSKNGDRSQVVGYWSVAVSHKISEKKEETGYSFNDKDKMEMLSIARSTLEQNIKQHKKPVFDTAGFSPALKVHAGAFVTLTEGGQLRGCIGRFTADEPLYDVIIEMAIAAATQDERFPQVEPTEVDNIKIEISVLTPMKKINSIGEIVLGKHGIYIRKGHMAGTFLPQVAKETGWTKEEFLGHCARDKAGIGWDGWKTADIYTYEAIVFSESEFSGHKKK
ncbi:MAG: AmmeMemoRadiSam system protein B [Bacteroidota bacterium]|nr:AmmeMemoRadiSam system protein B [Bacteroidota bacterium]